MKQLLLRTSLCLSLATFAAPCLAKTQSPSDAPSKARYTVDSKIDDLAANPAVVQVVKAFVQKQRVAAGKPELTPDQMSHMLDLVGYMTPREVAKFPQVHLDDKALDQLNLLLAQVPAGSPPRG